jgi:hypothetical protein
MELKNVLAKLLAAFLFYFLMGWYLSLLVSLIFLGFCTGSFYLNLPREGLFWAYCAVLCGLVGLCQYRIRKDALKAINEKEKAP